MVTKVWSFGGEILILPNTTTFGSGLRKVRTTFVGHNLKYSFCITQAYFALVLGKEGQILVDMTGYAHFAQHK